ncbi:MAG TPA: glycosyltransferase [Candidatus Polarisedimenticolaceae bacterium]|nr:glycosyltransferase [Candidatus Polarisedimenticolaceae bacterium]
MSGAPRHLRVAHVYAHLEVGGIERSLVDLLPRLDRRRYETRMICLRRRGSMAAELERAGIPVEVCRCPSRLPVGWSARGLARALRERGVDLVHAHAEHAAHCATEAARLAGIPLVVATFHTRPGFRPRAVERERAQWTGRSANVYVSEAVRRDHLTGLAVNGGRSVVIRNGIDVDHFAAPPPPARLAVLRHELRLEGLGPVLLNVARLQRIKGPDDLLRAFAQVRARMPGAVLVMAGGGRRQSEVLAHIRALGLLDHVRLCGTRADVADLYHLADLHVMASLGEGFSLVVLEAMAAGLPQVLTAVGGNAEAIDGSGAAHLVPPEDPARLAQGMLALLGDAAERARMSEAARERARRFSIGEQVVRTERLYDSLATGKVALAR